MSLDQKSLQQTYAPNNACFGCGPANQKGLRIRSFAQGDRVICEWSPQPHHEAFPGVLNGGIIGSVLDCHSNWTAIWHLMQLRNLDQAPCMVTMEYSVQLRRPTPTDQPLRLVAWATEVEGDIVTVQSELYAGDKLCDRGLGKFVAVKPGHPAYYRW